MDTQIELIEQIFAESYFENNCCVLAPIVAASFSFVAFEYLRQQKKKIADSGTESLLEIRVLLLKNYLGAIQLLGLSVMLF